MSGSTIGGVIGAVVFTVFGGSPQVGWMVGSAIGGYVDPTQVYGPRLSDVRGQTSQVGGAIPRAWGTTPVPGNVIWQQPGVTEHKHTNDGKGSGTEQVTFTYTRSYAIMFHIGEIAGVLQIKRNGKIVYDARDDATLQAEYTAFGMTTAQALQRITGQRADNAKFIDRCAIYTGTQTQNPDPTIEAYKGVGNVSAYRGRAYFVVTDDETQAGEIAQYEVVVASCGTVTNAAAGAAWMFAFNSGSGSGTVKDSPDGLDWSASATSVPLLEGGSFGPTGDGFMARNGNEILATSAGSGPGSDRFAFRDANSVWHQVSMEASSSSGLKPLWTGSNWMICQFGSADTQVGDGLTFTSTGYELQSITNIGGRVLGVYATGAALGQVVCILLNTDGSLSEIAPDLDVGFATTGSAVIDSDGSIVGLAVQQDLGGTNRRVHIWSTGDVADTWEEQASPFPDFTGALAHEMRIHYARVLNQWVVCARNRLAMGSISSLVLEPTTFPNEITGIDSDGAKIVICGEGGMLYAWTPDDGWQSLSGGEGRGIMDVLSFGIPAGAVPVPDSPGSYVDQGGVVYVLEGYSTLTPCATTTVGDIVADLCELSGLTSDEYDVSQLTDTLDGFVVARETDAASVIESLRPIGIFDPAEWDGKFRGIKRGGTSVGSINGDDLVERDGDSFEMELVQQVELLRKVITGYLDTGASWAPNTQLWERRVGTINARGESVIEVSAVLGADQASTISKRKGFVSWGEPEKQKFSLPYRLAKYTPTDIINYTDEDAQVHTIRLMQIDDDTGVRIVESSTNCAEAYNATATGVEPKPPTITDTTVRGPTVLVPMNLDSLRAQDNVPGMYIAACGLVPGWDGCVVELSTNGGDSFRPIANITSPATMGYLRNPIGPATEPIRVTLYPDGELSSATVDSNGIEAGVNIAAIMTADVGEVIQFQTATALGNETYDLSSIDRGLNDTVPANHGYPDPFVLLNDAVIFVPIDVIFAGQTLVFRAVTNGTSSDAAQTVSVVYEPPTFVLDGGGP